MQINGPAGVPIQLHLQNQRWVRCSLLLLVYQPLHLINIFMILWGWQGHPHFTNEVTKPVSGRLICPQSHREQTEGRAGSEPRSNHRQTTGCCSPSRPRVQCVHPWLSFQILGDTSIHILIVSFILVCMKKYEQHFQPLILLMLFLPMKHKNNTYIIMFKSFYFLKIKEKL